MKSILCILCLLLAACSAVGRPAAVDSRFAIGSLLYSDNFSSLAKWSVECERPGKVVARDGELEIDVPAGCSVWFKTKLVGPVMIEFTATPIKAGGPNDNVRDVNCFWMASDPRSPGSLFDVKRTGKFTEYDFLKTYYVGLGGNGNTTTRFRRYVGEQGNRPLNANNDLGKPEDLLVANEANHIQVVACGNLIQYYRNGKKLFELSDPEPYTEGWFAFRTTVSHLMIRDFRVWRLSS